MDLRHPLDLLDRHVRLDHRQDGLQLHHLLVIENGWEPEIIRVRGWLPLRPSPLELQLIPISMSDGDCDQPAQEERQRERSRSRERVHPLAQVPHIPQIQPMVNPESDDVSDEDFTVSDESLITCSWTTTFS